MALFMLVYGGTINVFSLESMLEGEATGFASFLIGSFVVALGALSDRDRHRDYVAEARREELADTEKDE